MSTKAYAKDATENMLYILLGTIICVGIMYPQNVARWGLRVFGLVLVVNLIIWISDQIVIEKKPNPDRQKIIVNFLILGTVGFLLLGIRYITFLY